ncbi:MAG: 3-phosphoshikimate 1-carboxyvinyltransferase [Clostridia bacterium]|nr:3-phosphoshikimate 1-carboxyvinyltransferase [Clostridia bacterium]
MIIKPSKLCGKISSIASKSVAHRLLICAALSDKATKIKCSTLNSDIEATVRCLNSLGADIKFSDGVFDVLPIKEVNKNAVLDCGESGSTLRFLLPVAAALGADSSFIGKGRLKDRPLSPLYEELERNGCILSPQGAFPLTVKGKLRPSDFIIDGGVSSQFISGLLFALPLLDGKSSITIKGEFQSKKYVDMTLDAMKLFSVEIDYFTSGNQTYKSKGEYSVEGDWSNAAFFLCAGAVSDSVEVEGLNINSLQGDKEILSILSQFGAKVEGTKISPAQMKGITIDASQIPDLIPVLSVVACKAEGDTKIINAERLRLKESDRLSTIAEMLKNLGADVEELPDGMIIHSKGHLSGGKVNSYNDHRIAMSAAIASLISKNEVTIIDENAINKSYPTFFEDFKKLGGQILEERVV